MSQITVMYRGEIANATGVRQAIMEASTVRDIMRQIKQQYGSATYKSAKRMLVAVNGLAINRQKGYATGLKDGDVVKMFPICGGG